MPPANSISTAKPNLDKRGNGFNWHNLSTGLEMSSEVEPQMKYSYKFRLEARKQEAFDEEASRTEVQSYINELLGVKDKSHEKD